ncbi:DUF2625 domain-containing protein [Flavobacterium sp. RHBU_3]|uniref:DUF2625 domain-containing protein n=1 Tax=Flavobacterium sp. RHBU_3 TaxID=3391184 RepID=UPI0039854EAA
MRPVNDLINKEDPGWVLISEWIKEAKNKVEVLPVDKAKATEALFNIQVTTRSPMGAIIYETGGVLIDGGWIRILGSGSTRLNRSLPGWNLGKSITTYGQAAPFWLVADDAVGGFFLLNGGGLGSDIGKIYYLAPDSLEYEPLDSSYTDFIIFCFSGDLNAFYENLRWTGWEKDIQTLGGDKMFSFYPYLWTKEGKEINKSSRKAVPVEEHYGLTIHFREQLGLK